MKKRFLTMLLAGAMVLSLAACGNKNDTPETTPTPTVEITPTPEAVPTETPSAVEINVAEVMESFLSKVQVPAMMEGTEAELTELYKLDPAMVASYSIRVPMMNVSATEFAMFEAATEEDVQKIVDGINSRVESLVAVWETYLPQQLALVQAHKILIQGNYVFFIVAEEDIAAYAENVFLRQFDPSIEEMVMLQKFYNLESAQITEASEEGMTLTAEIDGRTFTFVCTYSDSFYCEGELSDFAVGDTVTVSFEEEVTESEEPIEAVLSYLAMVE